MTSKEPLPGVQEVFRDVSDEPERTVTRTSNALGAMQDLKDAVDPTGLLVKRLSA